MILRELTQIEANELNRMIITDTGNGYQVLLSMIAIDLMKEKAYERQLKYTDFSDYITNDYGQFGEDFMLIPLLETWLTTLEIEKKGVISEKDKEKIFCLSISLIDIICTISCGLAGRLHRDIIKFYKEVDEKVFNAMGINLINSPEYCYRFIISCLEHVDLERKPSESKEKVDVTGVYYTDL